MTVGRAGVDPVVLEAVLAVMQGRRVVGWSDCAFAAADVFLRLHGVDPLQGLRGLYSSAREARGLIRARGGMALLCADQAARVGLRDGVGGAGEIGLHRNRALVISIGGGVWQGKARDGTVPVYDVERSWRA